MTQQIPIFLNSDKFQILIAGATDAAVSKAMILLERGAPVTMVGRGIAQVAEESGLTQSFGDQITLLDRAFEEDDLAAIDLVYIAEDSEGEEKRILAWSRFKGKCINVVDKPGLSDFSTPAAVRRGPVSIAISSGGDAPVFVRRIRAVLEGVLPQSLSMLAKVSGQIRPALKSIFSSVRDRRDYWDDIYDRADEFYGLEDWELSNQLLSIAKNKAAADRASATASIGTVQLVGAGPGDPELLTIKAHRALQRADIIYYDRLVSQQVLSLARRDASFVFVGKTEGSHGIGQDKINELLVEQALAGQRVVRLKGGDPLTFARAGEELATLRDNAIPVEIIPGITALSGIAAKAQIPITDRNHAASLTLVTGTLQDGSTQDWADAATGLAGPGKTLAVYMGIKKADAIAAGLILGGIAEDTPVAIIENGTRPDERQIYTTLSDLADSIQKHKVVSPALLIIGDVVSNAAQLVETQNNINNKAQAGPLQNIA